MRQKRCLAALAVSCVLLAVGAVGAQPTVNPAGAALDGAPRARVDRNQLRDVDIANPAQDVGLMAPPGANNQGDAALSYPLDLPEGRRGLKPEVEIQYSSAAPNGWLGVGWSLSVPEIAIETRWGVPRYDPLFETETYVLRGKELTPVAHRGPPSPRSGDKTFHERIEGAFNKITRHGNHPGNYWWEVTNSAGVRYFYGDDPGGPAGTHTLRDGYGNIFRWALRRVQDLRGNNILYSYSRVEDTGLPGGFVPGSQLYPKAIQYTGTNGGAGPYSVTFVRDRELGLPRRSDVAIDGRGGFKMVTADLLRRVEVAYAGQLIRRYDLDYTSDAYGDSLLSAVTQRGEDLSVFNAHTFDYFSEPLGFAPPEIWSTGDDDVSKPAIPFGGPTALGGSVTTQGGGHVYIGFNPTNPTKQNSFGGKIGFSFGQNDGVLELTDVNGDGLPDKVFKTGLATGGSYFVRYNQAGPGGSTSFGPVMPLASLPGISVERSAMISLGAEAYPAAANLLFNYSETFGIGSTYLADVNSDGLIDIVSNGMVFFNHYDGSGAPIWDPNSATTGVPVSLGQMDADGAVPDFEDSYQRQIDMFPLADTVRRWVAPYDGFVDIQGDAALVPSDDPARASYQTADGVRVAIQQNGEELWSDQIGATDYAPHSPSGVTGIPVQAGDRLYFRVQSLFDGSYDEVAWDPEIKYVNQPATTDVNGLDPYRFKASEDFVLAGRPHAKTPAPLNGVVHLSGDLHKNAVTTDDVSIILTRNGQTVLQQSLGAEQTGDIALDTDITVAKDDLLELRAGIDSPISLAAIEWLPTAYYTSSPDVDNNGNPVVVYDDQGQPLIHLNLIYDEDAYPNDGLSAPQAPWTAPNDGTVSVVPQIAGSPDASGTIVFTVKRQGELLAKQSIQMTGGAASPSAVSVDVSQNDKLYFDFSVSDPELGDKITTHSVTADNDAVPSAVHRAGKAGLFPVAYRGWSVAGYNGNRDRATLPIDESLLVLPPSPSEDDCDPDQFSGPDDFTQSNCSPSKTMAWAFAPVPTDGVWRGPTDRTYLGNSGVSSSRAGAAYISVPRPGQFAASSAPVRLSHTSQIAVGAGIGPLAFSATPFSLSQGIIDFMDLNGDGFPDILSTGKVQYTLPTGALVGSAQPVPGIGFLDAPRESSNYSYGLGISGSPTSSTGNSRGRVGASSKGSPKSNKSSNQMPTLGLGGDLGFGNSDMTGDYVDINGDGLPDRVHHSGGQITVSLNLGYKFAPAEPWGAAQVNVGASRSYGVGVSPSFNSGDYGFAAGVSYSGSDSQGACNFINPITSECVEQGQMLTDVNGDGRPDRVTPNGSSLLVAFNEGSGFGPDIQWDGAIGGPSKASMASLGGGAYFTIPVGPLCVAACYLIINPGFDVGQAISRQESAILDVDGDGYPDHVVSGEAGHLLVARNRHGRTGLLKTVHRPLGAVISLEYERDGNTFANAPSRWLLTKVSTSDGHAGDGVDTRVTRHHYAGGVHDRLERDFYGYSQVVTEDRDASNGEALYRSTVREFRTDSYYSKGLLTRETVLDAAGHKYLEEEHTYAFRDVATGLDASDLASTTDTLFPMRIRSDKSYYEGQAAPGKTTYSTVEYDALGRVVRSADAADVGTADDTVEETEYSFCSDTNVLGVPTKIVVRDGTDTVMRHTESTVDCATGDVTQTRAYLDDLTAAVTDTTYDTLGNVATVAGPANAAGQRYQVTYTYDAATSMFPATTTDSFGYVTTTTYDPRHGKITSSTDPNQNTTSSEYDVFGRLTSVRRPQEQGGPVPTVTYEYHHDAATPWAITRRFDTFHPADTIDTVVFIDGERREIQRKQDLTVHAGPGVAAQDLVQVSGKRVLDFAGRVIEERYPVVEAPGTPGAFNSDVDQVAPKITVYDVLDRPVSVTTPDGAHWATAYDFGPDRYGAIRLRTTTTDPNGVQRSVHRDVRTLIKSVQELNKAGTEIIWTSYFHDATEKLILVVDDHGNTTVATYDALGRRTGILSPDSGQTALTYDLAGNLTDRATATLGAAGQTIHYTYDHNRLTDVVYPVYAENSIHYTYGAPGAAGNGAGEIVQVNDSSGYEQRTYGKLGEITKTVRQIMEKPSRGGDLYGTYTTEYTYDSFGRLQTLTYPDGEVLTYAYDSGGLVRAASGVKAGLAYAYVNRVEYDKFGAAVFSEYENGVRTTRTIDPVSRDLATLEAGKNGSPFQNVSYTRDPAGNILSLSNNIPVPPPSSYNGPSVQTFTYDDLTRLTGATGTYQYGAGKSRLYTLSLAYDTIHNLTSKQQTDVEKRPSNKTVVQHDTTYSTAFTYGSLKPHAATHADGRTFQFDADGNQTGWQSDSSGNNRVMVWNEDDRIESISDNGSTTLLQYSDAGERLLRRGPDGRTVYVNEYYTEDPGQNARKHVFVGAARVVSKRVKAPPELEDDQFFYHPDHIGNITYVTDVAGALAQHLEYFPFGEQWLEDQSTTVDLPYRFGGKELDEGTSLYYFGARYYDARTSQWQSADPALSDYLDGRASGGVYGSMNLEDFAYAAQNPIGNTDPDGRMTFKDAVSQSVGSQSKPANRFITYARMTVQGLAQVKDFNQNKVPTNDYTVPGKEPAFWTGGANVAGNAARQAGMYTLEDTPGGKATIAVSEEVLGKFTTAYGNKRTGYHTTGELWSTSSLAYADAVIKEYGPNGPKAGQPVCVFIAHGYRKDSVYFKDEKPRLQKAGVVLTEIYLPKEPPKPTTPPQTTPSE